MPCFRGSGMLVARCMPVKMNKVTDQTEMLRNSLFPTGSNSQDSAGPLPCLFPSAKAQLLQAGGVNCSVLHSGDMINILLRDKFSQQHFKSTLVSSKQIADRLPPKGWQKRGPSVSASPVSSSPQFLSC